jgi:PhzF family phenazine biosynthesis protein
MDFYIVDAFTKTPFGGNPAGVVIYDYLDDATMQKLAAELKFSETAFIKKLSSSCFSIRYFTPNSEVALCGHATIASFKALLYSGLVETNRTYDIKTISALLPIYISNDLIFMETSAPLTGGQLNNTHISKLATVLGITSADIGDFHFDLQPSIVSTGLYDIILPVKTSNILYNIKPDFDALSELSKELGVIGVHAFTLDSGNFTAICRNFAPLYDINEESATGTSNASLTYYLYINNVIKDLDRDYIFRQGESMNRPSDIITRPILKKDLKILVGGTAAILSKGQLLL